MVLRLMRLFGQARSRPVAGCGRSEKGIGSITASRAFTIFQHVNIGDKESHRVLMNVSVVLADRRYVLEHVRFGPTMRTTWQIRGICPELLT